MQNTNKRNISKCCPRWFTHTREHGGGGGSGDGGTTRLQKLKMIIDDSTARARAIGRRLHVINHLSNTNSVPFTTFAATIVCCFMMMIFHLFAKFELLHACEYVCVIVAFMCFFSHELPFWIFIFCTHNFLKTLLFCVSTNPPWNYHHN